MGKHAVEDDTYVVASVNTEDGLKPVVVAAHPVIGKSLFDLLELLGKFEHVDFLLTDKELEDLEEAYLAFIRSPQTLLESIKSPLTGEITHA